MELAKRSLKGQSVLITGGAGFIGSHLVDRIIKENPSQIIVVDNFFLGSQSNIKSATQLFPDLEVVRLDASNLAAMQDVVKRFKTDVVFDLATVPLPASLEYPNWTTSTIVGVASTFCEIARLGLIESLVHLSSSEAYGSALYVPMDEKHPHNPSTPYAGGKAAADIIIQSYVKTFNIDATIIRPFNNFGPRQNLSSYPGIIPVVINNVRNGLPINIFGDGEQTRDFTFVTETADFIVRIFSEERCHKDVWNVATGIETTINNLVRKVIGAMGVEDQQINYLPERLGDVRRHCADVSKTHSALNLTPEGINEIQIQKTVDWYLRSIK
jgi:UDP-glucose 4-epimerase